MNTRRILFSLILVTGACQTPDYDVILRHGTVYDGTGTAPVVTDVAIAGDTIAAIGDLSDASVHQHAELGDRVAHRGWPFPKRHPARRHAGSLRGRLVDGPIERIDEAGITGATG